MTLEEIKQNIWKNTVSNYVCVAVRLVTGLIMFRMLYQNLETEKFGFWCLLWTVFGYGILLDFGFGFTAQKRVAELSVHQDWNKLSEVLSTIFFTYIGVAVLFVLMGLFGSGVFVGFLEVTPGNRQEFIEVLAHFLCGLGIAFPLGLFPEMLRGQQKIGLANYVFCIGMIVNFILVAAAVQFGWGLKALVWIALTCTFIPDLICGVFAFRSLPGVKVQPRYFSVNMISETMSFSLVAYVITLSTLILTKTDQLVISSALAVSAVAIYQAGAKAAEVFAGLTQQLPDTFSPVAAHLYAKGDHSVLRSLLINGTRFSVMVATPLYLLFAFYMKELLWLLTGEPNPAAETFWTGQVLLLWGYVLVATQSVSKRVFMMCGHEKRLMYFAIGEALLNLGLSIGLVMVFKNVLGVAVGSLLSSLVFGCFIWPWAAREVQISGLAMVRAVFVPTWTACLPLLLLIVVERMLPDVSLRQSWAISIIGGCVALTMAAWGLWRLALTTPERQKFATLITKNWKKAV